MSYDIDLTIDTGGDYHASVEDVGNYTCNVSPMYRKAFGDEGINSFNGLTGLEACERLKDGIHHMIINKEKYEKLNPENGWGDYHGALFYLQKLMLACLKHPKATIRIY